MANSGDGDSKVREPQRSHYYKVFRYGENGSAEEHYLGADRRAPGMLTTPEQCQQRLNERTSLAAWKGMLFMLTSWLEAEVFEGGKAADSSLFRLDGNSCRLLQFARAARPLVISFGSNT
ncbi:uncharacterized protein LOC144911891 isoform X3 [Branchiostoma floridae x Branchiostoma belcheri]